MYGDYSYISPESITPYSTMPIDGIETVGSAVLGTVAGVAVVMFFCWINNKSNYNNCQLEDIY